MCPNKTTLCDVVEYTSTMEHRGIKQSVWWNDRGILKIAHLKPWTYKTAVLPHWGNDPHKHSWRLLWDEKTWRNFRCGKNDPFFSVDLRKNMVIFQFANCEFTISNLTARSLGSVETSLVGATIPMDSGDIQTSQRMVESLDFEWEIWHRFQLVIWSSLAHPGCIFCGLIFLKVYKMGPPRYKLVYKPL